MHVNKWLAAAVTLLMLMVAGALVYLVGMRAGSSQNVPAAGDAMQESNARPTATRRKISTPRTTILTALGTADLEALGSGCMCRFTQGDTDFLFVGRANVIVRPNERQLVSPMNSDAFERTYNQGENCPERA